MAEFLRFIRRKQDEKTPPVSPSNFVFTGTDEGSPNTLRIPTDGKVILYKDGDVQVRVDVSDDSNKARILYSLPVPVDKKYKKNKAEINPSWDFGSKEPSVTLRDGHWHKFSKKEIFPNVTMSSDLTSISGPLGSVRYEELPTKSENPSPVAVFQSRLQES